jgi:hypothetical protein
VVPVLAEGRSAARTPVEWCCVRIAAVAGVALIAAAYIHASCNPTGDVPEPGPGADFHSYCSVADVGVAPMVLALSALVVVVVVASGRRTVWVNAATGAAIGLSVIAAFLGWTFQI